MIAIYLLLAGIVGTSAVVAWHALGDRHSIEHYHKTMEALAETARRSPGQLRPGAPPANEGLESHPTPALGRDRLVFGDELGDDEPRNIPAIPPAGMGRGRRVARTARLRLSRFIAAAVLAVLVGSVLAVLLLGTGRTSPGGGHPARHASQARPVPVA
ncbi:MAG: hypothetical protein JWO62_2466, partial [Acidimicrobiaceae bacterium]|nr:hypothetical protein [Acidimicrobiaceae bacterium]